MILHATTGGAFPLHPVYVPEPLLAELLSGQMEVFDLEQAAAFLKATEAEVVRMVREQGCPPVRSATAGGS